MDDLNKSPLEDTQLIIDEKIIKEDGEEIIKRYIRGHMLGKGGFAKCYQFTDMETNITYASKIINKESLNKGRAKEKVYFLIKFSLCSK